MENKTLNKIENAEELAKVTGIIDGAEVDIDLALPELENGGGCDYIVNIGTTGGLRKTSMSAERLDKFLKWSTDPEKKGTYCIIHGNGEVFVEVIKHEAITGVRFKFDEDMKEEMEKDSD